MTEELSILNRTGGGFAVEIDPLANQAKEEALAMSALIGRVTDGIEQERAVKAQSVITELLRAAESARATVKRPAIDFGTLVDGLAKQYRKELVDEELRLCVLLADFQALENARVRSEQSAHNEALTELERRREAELAKTTSEEERTEIQARYCQEASFVPGPVAPARADGQIVGERWLIEVFDPLALAKAYPQCVNILPLKREIYGLLDAGISLPGVKAERGIKSAVRRRKRQDAITV